MTQESKLTFLHCINMQFIHIGKNDPLSGRQPRYAVHIWSIRELWPDVKLV